MPTLVHQSLSASRRRRFRISAMTSSSVSFAVLMRSMPKHHPSLSSSDRSPPNPDSVSSPPTRCRCGSTGPPASLVLAVPSKTRSTTQLHHSSTTTRAHMRCMSPSVLSKPCRGHPARRPVHSPAQCPQAQEGCQGEGLAQAPHHLQRAQFKDHYL